MPELPEVETIRQQLSQFTPFSITHEEKSQHFKSLQMINHFKPLHLVVTEIDRLGKVLIFKLNDGKFILSRLGMSGGWRIGAEKIKEKHTHYQMKIKRLAQTSHSSQEELYLAYVDPRRFGKLYFANEKGLQDVLKNVGIDLTSSAFDENYLRQVLKRYPKRMIKVMLLDQKYFAGCGNYIASEICARAGILPTRLNQDLKGKDFARLIAATKEVLQGALYGQGTTFQGGYADTKGEQGEGVNNLMVFYQKTCQKCLKTAVEKIFLAGRGTYFCPKCQK